MRTSLVALLALAACSAAQDPTPPTLEVTTPQRGASADSTQISVTGTTSHATRVTVNGNDVPIAKDGTFQMSLELGPGIAIIETHAISGDKDVRDVRAVLAGPVAPTDGTVKAPLGAHASAAALQQVGNAIATAAQAVDYTAAVQPMNPVYNNGGCLGAQINITTVSIGTVDAALAPRPTSSAPTSRSTTSR